MRPGSDTAPLDGRRQDRTVALPPVPGSPLPPPAPPGRPPDAGVPPAPAPGPPRRRRPSRRRLLLRWAVLLLVLLGIYYLALGAWTLTRLQKVDALADYRGRPADAPGQTWLLVGSDSREGLSAEERRRLRTGSTEGQRTDTILLLHVPSGGRPALVSLPRDSYVTVPAHRSGGRAVAEHRDKLNAAYSAGGAPLLVRTVEQATDLRVDHYVEVGFAGVVDVVDAVGGVDLCVERAITDARAGLNLKAGCQTLHGAAALGYVRTRYTDPRGDLGRIDRQQRFLAALTQEAASPATVLNPLATTRLATAGTGAVRVDNATGPVDLSRVARAMRTVAAGDGVTTTVPVANPAASSAVGSVVRWDTDRAEALFDALRAGRAPSG